MNTITTLKAHEIEPSALVQHIGLYCRDLYELNGDTGPHQIKDETTTVAWDPERDAAVFDWNGVELVVPSAALDDVRHLVVTDSPRTKELPR